jgi:hypothetical protein
MITKDELFKTGDRQRIWQKYCGFLDLSLDEFMEIQEEILMEQIELVHSSPLAKKFMPKKPKGVSEFRRLVPLTTYDDYAGYLTANNEEVLAVKPYCWSQTSGRGGMFKWVPYTDGGIENFARLGVAMVILACTMRRGEVNIGTGLRMLQCMPPPPYMSGIISQVLNEYFDARCIPPLDKYKDATFEARLQAGFEMALITSVDTLTSLTNVLVKMGERFTESSRQLKVNRHMLHPQIIWRLVRAILRSKREGRTLLPKDLWPIKGLICYGTDTDIYRNQLVYYWGRQPFETYAATEAGVIAMHAWNKRNMTFTPSSCFLEFAPEEEWLKSRDNKDYQPKTILLDEVKPGEHYEVIITSFYGMPFLRYRLGDLIKIVALQDDEAGIKLPQMVFESRSDDIIDISGFPRLDERTIWQAIANTGIKYEDWSARKEYQQNEPIIHLYIELKEEIKAAKVEELIHRELVSINPDYKELENMLGIRPLRVTLLPPGSFQRYYEEKQKAGVDLAHLKPRHINASDAVIQDLVKAESNPTETGI